MGRNRKGLQCGGYASKKEKFVLQKHWNNEISKVVSKLQRERQKRRKKQQNQMKRQQHVDDRSSIPSSLNRRAQVSVVRALMNMRVQDDRRESLNLKRTESIINDLQETSLISKMNNLSLQERCLNVIARTLDMYDPSCIYTQQAFATLEPWMITELSELSAVYKTSNDENASLLLLQQTSELTLSYINDENALNLFTKSRGVHAECSAFFNTSSDTIAEITKIPARALLKQREEVESWDDLIVDEIELVAAEPERAIEIHTLRIISCPGLSEKFILSTTNVHTEIERLEIIDSFTFTVSIDTAFDWGEKVSRKTTTGASVMLNSLATWRKLKTLRFSWCNWLDNNIVRKFAMELLDKQSPLEKLYISHCFDISDEYVSRVFQQLLPRVQLEFTLEGEDI